MGHGHVRQNPDQQKARCGGPGLCSECSKELQAEASKIASEARFVGLCELTWLARRMNLDVGECYKIMMLSGMFYRDEATGKYGLRETLPPPTTSVLTTTLEEIEARPSVVSVRVQLDHPNAQMPYRGSKDAAGYDLRCVEAFVASPGDVIPVPTGLRLEIPSGYEGQIRARGSMAKDGMIVANGPGTIDADYRGELFVVLANVSRVQRTYSAGHRIAQLVIAPVQPVEYVAGQLQTSTDRGEGRFGSTGTH